MMWITIYALGFFVGLSWQQKDPLADFCRRWGHQTAVIDRKLYIDGGQVNWNPIPQNPNNYTSKRRHPLPFFVEISTDYFLFRYMASIPRP